MALKKFGISLPLTVPANAPTTLLQLFTLTADDIVAMTHWSIFFKGVDSAAVPVEVILAYQDDTGTFTADAGIVELSGFGVDPTTVGTRYDYTAEPNMQGVISAVCVHPQSGYEIIYPFDAPIILGPANRRLGIVCMSDTQYDLTLNMYFEE